MAGLGDLQGGYRFAKLAKALLLKFGHKETAGEVICVTTGILSYIEPYQAVKEELQKGPSVAMAAGGERLRCLPHILRLNSTLSHDDLNSYYHVFCVRRALGMPELVDFQHDASVDGHQTPFAQGGVFQY